MKNIVRRANYFKVERKDYKPWTIQDVVDYYGKPKEKQLDEKVKPVMVKSIK